MTTLRFALALAVREARGSGRRLVLLAAAVATGVAALVALDSFTASLQASVGRQSRRLLGADVVLWSAGSLSPRAAAALAGAAAEGASVARVTSFAAMAHAPEGTGTRLVQVLAVEPGYPFYGDVRTEPAGEWERLQDGGALVDAEMLAALDVRVGGTLAVGEAHVTIRGTIVDVPGDVGLRAALGPRVYLSAREAPRTGLLLRGSRVRHDAFVRLPAGADAQRVALDWRRALAKDRVGVRTATEGERRLNANLGRVGRFFGLAAFAALLLGGVAVASAVHAFVRRKTETIAVLRCLGATPLQIGAAYLLQSSGVALAGSLAGAAAGTALQWGLPWLFGGLLPLDVELAPSAAAVAAGLGVGLVVSAAFAALPLLAVRHVSPLAILRRAQPRPRRDGLRWLVLAALAGTVTAVAAHRTGGLASGAAFAAGLGAVLGLLGFVALGLVRGMRGRVPSWLGYEWRQGLAGLHRPGNQTVAAVLALGMGVFVLATLLLVETGLLHELDAGASPTRPNLALFDVQPDQRAALEAVLEEHGAPAAPAVPIVPMRVLSVKGRSVAELLDEERPLAEDGEPRGRWTLRREYRSTYRDAPVATENVVLGRWWRRGAGRATPPVPVSVETGVAREMGVGVGDEVVWDVQGVAVATRIANLRDVEWARLAPNFFVVFPEGVLEDAPQTLLLLSRVEDAGARGRLERAVALRFPNVSSLDLTRVQRTAEEVVGRLARALEATALFCLAAGAMVLAGAVAAVREERLREAVLLRTLGATRRQLLAIAFAESLAVGLLAAAAALPLALGAAWGILAGVLDTGLAVPWPSLAALGAGVSALAVVVGLAGSVEILRRTPLESLRAEVG